MFIPFDELNQEARVWIYQADRSLKKDEVDMINETMLAFCKGWKAHNKDLKASFSIAYDRFLIVAVEEDQQSATGCSIDNSVHTVAALGNQINVEFLDRSQIAFLVNDEIKIFTLPAIKQKVADGEITENSKVFNNNILTKKDLTSKWLVPVTEGWTKKYFNQVGLKQ